MPKTYTELTALHATLQAVYAHEHNAGSVSHAVSDEDLQKGFDALLIEFTDAVDSFNAAKIADFVADKSAADFIKSHSSVLKVAFKAGEVCFLRTKIQWLSMSDYFHATMTEEVYKDFCADLRALKDKVFSRAINFVFSDKVVSGCVSDVKKLVAEFARKYNIDLQGKEVSSWIARRLMQSCVCHAGKHIENVKACSDSSFAMLLSIFLHCLLNNVKPRVNADKEESIDALIKSILKVD